MLRIIYLSFLSVFLTIDAMGQSSVKDTDTSEMNYLIDKAREDQKNILLYYTAEWCTPCKVMQNTVFLEESVKEFIDKNFIWRQVDVDSAEAKEFLERFEMGSIPQFNVIDGQGDRIFSFNGSMSAEKFLERLEESRNPKRGELAISTERYEQGDRSIDFLSQHLSVLEEYQSPKAREIYLDFFSTANEAHLDSIPVLDYMEKYLITESSDDYDYLLTKKDDLIYVYGAERVNRLLARPSILLLEEKAIEGDSQGFETLVDKITTNGWATDDDLYYNKKIFLIKSGQLGKFVDLVDGDEYRGAFQTREDRLFDGASMVMLSDLTDDEEILNHAINWIEQVPMDRVDRLMINGQLNEAAGNLNTALTNYERALELFKKENPDSPVLPTGITTLIDRIKVK